MEKVVAFKCHSCHYEWFIRAVSSGMVIVPNHCPNCGIVDSDNSLHRFKPVSDLNTYTIKKDDPTPDHCDVVKEHKHLYDDNYKFRVETSVGNIFIWRCMVCRCLISDIY